MYVSLNSETAACSPPSLYIKTTSVLFQHDTVSTGWPWSAAGVIKPHQSCMSAVSQGMQCNGSLHMFHAKDNAWQQGSDHPLYLQLMQYLKTRLCMSADHPLHSGQKEQIDCTL